MHSGHPGHRHVGHDHGTTTATADVARALAFGAVLNAVFVVVEIAAGVLCGSLALVADAGHNAGDTIGLVLAWAAERLARRPPSSRYTWGFRRSTIYAALANAVLLLTACGAIVWEALRRLSAPQPVGGTAVIAVAAIGVAINLASALLLRHGSRHDANVRGAFLHLVADAGVSVGVVVAGIAMVLTGLTWIDPAVSIAVTLAIVVGTWGLFRESVDLALDAVPRGIDPAAVLESLSSIPGVQEVHDLHVWSASTSEISLTAHLLVPDAEDHDRVLATASERMRERFGIGHTTIQIERAAATAACLQRPADTL